MNKLIFATAVYVFCTHTPVKAEIIGGVDFPDGASSFADVVLLYDCAYNDGAGNGTCPTTALNPNDSLGIPDGSITSIGLGGLLELGFIDNLLTNSGGTEIDLWIFELGADVEATRISLRATAATLALPGFSGTIGVNGYYEIGNIGGSTSGIDIDSAFPGFPPGVLQFDAVQLIDLDYNPANGGTHGADIDAVGAIETVSVEKIFKNGFE